MKSKIFSALFLLSLSNFPLFAFSQSANTNQIGLRLGGFSGITFRHVSGNNVAVEANLTAGYHADWTMISVLGEKHIPLGDDGFVIFLGAGAFLAFDADHYYEPEPHYYWNHNAGIETVVGLDYYIPKTPLNVGIDVRPRFAVINNPYPWDAAISFRYIF